MAVEMVGLVQGVEMEGEKYIIPDLLSTTRLGHGLCVLSLSSWYLVPAGPTSDYYAHEIYC